MTPLKIVQLHSNDYGGGAEAVARLNHKGLVELGHSAELLVAKKTGDEEFVRQVSYRRGIPGSRRIAKAVQSLTGLQNFYSPSFREVSQEFSGSPNIVHMHAMHGASEWADLTGLATVAKHFPVVCSLHDLWWLTGHCAYGMECVRWQTGCGACPDLDRYPAVSRDGTAWNWTRKKKFFEQNPINLIAPSEWVRRQTEESPILSGCAVSVVPNPIDVETFTANDREGARNRLNVQLKQPTILVAANHLASPFKGAHQAIEVINGLADNQVDVLVLLVGKNCDELARRINIPSRSLGYISDVESMADCYRSADVFLVPSKVETFGLVAAEAVACGTVVASFYGGGLQEVVRTGHGIAVPDGDSKQLTQAVRSLLENPDERAARVAQGRQEVVKKYSCSAHAAGCVEVYRRAIQQFSKQRTI